MNRAERSVKFLTEEVPLLLEKLTPETKPLWGIMTAQHMVEHLQFALAVTTGARKLPVLSPWYTRPFYKLFILGYRPFPKNIRLPGQKSRKLPMLQYSSLAEAKTHLMQAIQDTLEFLRLNPSVRNHHPFGGKFSPQEWQIFHQRHFTHHFQQFNLFSSNI